MKAYPARYVAVLMAAIGAAVAFGLVELTPAEVGAVEALLVALVPVVAVVQGLLTERRVYAPRTVAKLEREKLEAYHDGHDARMGTGYQRGKARDR